LSFVHNTKRYCCDIIFLNIHAPTEDEIDDVKDSFYEELEHIFDELHKYSIKILSGDFSAEMLSNVLSRLSPYVDEINGDHQCGFCCN
jgi:hypothetical protein